MLASLVGVGGPLPGLHGCAGDRLQPADKICASHRNDFRIDVQAVPELQAELLRRVSALPGLDIRPTVIGMFGAKGFWLLEDVQLARPEVIYHGREYAHLHTDGSLHASLPPKRAFEAVAAGWAIRHPSAQYHDRLEGFVLLYTPRTPEELDITFQLIVDGYNFVTGQDVQLDDL